MDNVSVDVVGSGPQLEELKTRAAELGVDATFHGFIDPNQIYDIYSQSDIQVVPSLREPWGIIVEEGLSSGLFVISAPLVGASERIRPGYNGMILDEITPEKLRGRVKNFARKNGGPEG